MLKKMILCLSLLLITQTLYAESREYFLGTINLAGLVPSKLPAEGTMLHLYKLDQALTTSDEQVVGHIPRKFRDPLFLMLEQGLDIRFEVTNLFADPLPGKFITVEVWVTTNSPEYIQPLIYSIPVLEAPSLTAMND